MRYYFAPMEGITGYIFRNTYEEYFDGITKYFTPFLAPNRDGGLRGGEKRDVLPENNSSVPLVPQILTNSASAFRKTADWLHGLGYEEVNLNLGCPSATVVTKKKGAGMLGDLDALRWFLDEIFTGERGKISVKTRLGMSCFQEFDGLLELFSQYPIAELIVHARVREQFYRGTPDWEPVAAAAGRLPIPLCCNGDLFCKKDIQELHARIPQADCMMIGRGLLANPWMLSTKRPEKEQLRAFHDALLERYQEILSGDRNVLFKMKELWVYLACRFKHHEKAAKKIQKAQTLRTYRAAVDRMFEQELWEPE